jgi:hypothetical protein
MPRGFLYYEVMRLLNPRRRRSDKSNHELLKAVVEHELGDVIEALSKGVCPFCGRSFRGYIWARSHTARSNCSLALRTRVEDALRLYRKLSGYVRRVNGKYQLRVGDYRSPYFNTKRELARWLEESGLLGKLKGSF